jgi:hypothetical protein
VAGYLVVCLVLISNNLTFQEPYYIWFERSGGFAGITTSIEIDSKSLSSEDTENLRQLIDQSGFFVYHKTDSIPGNMPDQFQYKISIACDGIKQTVEFSDSTVPENFRPLLDYLTQKARSKTQE